jgi:hypothetical protein
MSQFLKYLGLARCELGLEYRYFHLVPTESRCLGNVSGKTRRNTREMRHARGPRDDFLASLIPEILLQHVIFSILE